jgi:CTP:phosphocholine cytidylyltransferase-like protein
MLRKPELIQKYQFCSNYLGVPVCMTDDWYFQTKNGYINTVGIGSKDCYHMFGISYWNAADGAKLREDIRQVYEAPGGKERYWDLVPLQYCKDHYQVEARPCSFEDVAEIDTIMDLKKLDPAYI